MAPLNWKLNLPLWVSHSIESKSKRQVVTLLARVTDLLNERKLDCYYTMVWQADGIRGTSFNANSSDQGQWETAENQNR